jgi:Na+/melibiose symporter-like transporter
MAAVPSKALGSAAADVSTGPATSPAQASSFGWQDGWRYGLMGFPLAFVALPLYVVLPNFYALQFGVPLATLGALLLGARLFDAVIDPLLGRWSDRLYARAPGQVLWWAALAAVALALGFALLFFPPLQSMPGLLLWALACLLLTYTAFSALSIMHQSWGAMLGGNEARRARIVAWREGLGLLGVVLASVAPLALGMAATCALFVLALVVGWWAWSLAIKPADAIDPSIACVRATALSGSAPATAQHRAALWLPFANPGFRALLAVFVVNGIASAVPATLILFFVQDRLQAPAQMQPFFLGSYFLSAALAIPLWLRLVERIGLARTWGLGMLLAVAVFAFAALLGPGDGYLFLLVCALSGVALGTDLALPAALLAGSIASHGDRGRAEGAYFGWWNFATKLNLALAAGVALPLLGWLGYAPGAQDAAALQTLSLAYCLLPCALKLLAATLLYTLIIRRTP